MTDHDQQLVERVALALNANLKKQWDGQPFGIKDDLTSWTATAGMLNLTEMARAAIAECEKNRAELEAQCAAMRGALEQITPNPADNLGISDYIIGFRGGWDAVRTLVQQRLKRGTCSGWRKPSPRSGGSHDPLHAPERRD